MEGEGVPAPAISAVLDDDDLLSEILLRVAFPTSLVQVALVCKRWLRLASAPVFLRHFHDLHPPRLLGFYILTKSSKIPRFVPMPQPPELATVIRRASFDLDTLGFRCTYVRCCNGFLVLTSHLQIGSPEQPKWIVRCPLDPAGDMSILRPVQETSMHDGFTYYDIDEILPNSGSEDMSFFHLALGSNGKQTRMDVFLLKDDIWAIYSSVVTDIPKIKLLFPSLIGHGKIYNTADCVGMLDSKLFLLDLVTSSLSLVNLPEEMDLLRNTDLSLTHDAGLHLIHVKGYQLRIWLHRMDNNGGSNWSLEGTVCLREICANSMIPTCKFKDVNGSFFTMYAVGTNSEFVFLGMEDVLYLFDIKSKAAKKVYEVKPEDQRLSYVTPIMMAWPPKFRVMN